MNNIQENTDKYCTGCGACVEACPVTAIEYKINNNGFFEAFVNEKKCINCGRCKKVCNKFNNKYGKYVSDGELIAAKTRNNNILMESTSGGIAYEIAKFGINNGFKIFGTVYDHRKNLAKAILINDLNELEETKGSKYIQSKSDVAIKEMIEDCKKNKDTKYMIFGTPCQISGISNLIKLENIKNEIIKIDLFCHGVPSYIIWNKYLSQIKEEYNLKEIKKCNFRSKHYGWHQYCIEIIDDSNKKIYLDEGKSDFYKLFFNCILLNKSCYDCDFRKKVSYADIRLGDYWGKKYYNNQTGVSAVVINTHKGKELINNISSNIEIISKGNLTEFLNNQSIEKYSNEIFNLDYWEHGKVNDKSLKEIFKEYKSGLNSFEKIKLNIKDIMGAISPKCKYNIKKIYYKIKN